MAEDVNHSVAADDMQIELERLLRVSPSPEFVARVRTQVAAEPAMSGRWVRAWEISRVQWGTALALMITAGVAYSGRTVTDSKPVAPHVAVARSGDVPLSSAPGFASVRIAEPAPDAVDMLRQVGYEPSRATPVLVSTSEAEGLRLFVTAVHDGLIDAAELPVSAPVGELAALEPIVWQPLVPAVGLEEEQQ